MTALVGVEGFKFGCDPEMFITDADGNLVSAEGLIPGTKQEPHKVDGGAVQVDGLAAEFNIDPVDNFKDWNDKIVSVMGQLKKMLPTGYGFLIEPSVRFSPEVLNAASSKAKELGCDPDYNAWTGEVNPYPDTTNDPFLRTASGHVHVGWLAPEDYMPVEDEIHRKHGFDLVKQFDWFLGAWSVLKDADVTRRQLYGKAGACRIKPYGMEYRVMSNFWIKEKDLRRHVWNRMQSAVEYMKSSEMARSYPSSNLSVQEIINTGNKEDPLFKTMIWPLMRIM
jgi:hypothetical protein